MPVVLGGEAGRFEHIGYVVAQHTAQWGEQCCEASQINFSITVCWNQRLPRRGNPATGVRRPARPGALAALLPSVATSPDNRTTRSTELTTSIECPFIAVGVENVWDGRETLELFAIVTLEPTGGDANSRCFEFGVSDEQLVEMNGVIRSPDALRQERLTRANNIPDSTPQR